MAGDLPRGAGSAAISGGFDHPARLSEAVMNQFRLAKKRITVSVGESVRIVRELQGLSQNQLAQRTGIPQATLSAIENDRVRLGRSEEHTSELQSQSNLVCRLLLEKKKYKAAQHQCARSAPWPGGAASDPRGRASRQGTGRQHRSC